MHPCPDYSRSATAETAGGTLTSDADAYAFRSERCAQLGYTGFQGMEPVQDLIDPNRAFVMVRHSACSLSTGVG